MENCIKYIACDIAIELKINTQFVIYSFFNINNRKLVEISRKKPNEERLYTNSNNDWVTETVESKLDIYVIEEYYYYVPHNIKK